MLRRTTVARRRGVPVFGHLRRLPSPPTSRVWRRSTQVVLVPLRIALLALALAATLAAAAAPTASADGGAPNLAYIVGGGPNGDELVIVDVSKGQVVQRVGLGAMPTSVLLSTDNRSAFVALPSANQIAVVDTSSHTVGTPLNAGPGPRSMALGFVGGTPLLYVADSGGNTVSVVDPAAHSVRATIAVGQHPSGVALAFPGSGIAGSDPNDNELYVANTGSDTVAVVSTLHQRVIATISVPGGPLGVIIPGSGGIAYISTQAGDVVAISLATHRVLGTLIHLRGAPGAMDYDAVTGQIYVPDPAGGVVDILRPAADAPAGVTPSLPAEPARTLPLSGSPSAVAITFDGAYGFVAERANGRVAMFDAAAHVLLTTIDVGGAPTAIITGAYPPAVSSQTAFLVNMAVVALVLVLMGGTIFTLGRQRKRAGKPANKEVSDA